MIKSTGTWTKFAVSPWSKADLVDTGPRSVTTAELRSRPVGTHLWRMLTHAQQAATTMRHPHNCSIWAATSTVDPLRHVPYITAVRTGLPQS